MEFSEIFGFLIILTQSIKLFFKNLKIMSSIVILSHLLLSIISLFFSLSIQYLMHKMYNTIDAPLDSLTPTPSYTPFPITRIIIYFAILITIEIASMYAVIKISHMSTMATILASALSHMDKTLTLQDFYSRLISRTWKNKPRNTFQTQRNMGHSFFIMLLFIPWFIYPMYPNPITLLIAIVLGIIAFVYSLYFTVASVLAVVVSVLEDGKEAIEKAEALLLKGQRIHGFAMNVLFNVLCLIIFWIYWIQLGDQWLDNLTTYGLVFVNALSLLKMFCMIGYTVLYFQCKKIHGEEIKSLGTFEYDVLVVSDIP